MTDFATRSRIVGVGFSAPDAPPRRPIAARREHFRQSDTLHALPPSDTVVHDCCDDVVKRALDDREAVWAARCLADRLLLSYKASVGQPDSCDKDSQNVSERSITRLLFTVGQRGSGELEFEYPRSVAVDAETGDVYVADTGNSRVKHYTGCGVFAASFGGHGSQPGNFRCPTSVVVPAFRSVVIVADRDNKLVQVFSKGESGCFEHELLRAFQTAGDPYSLAFNTEEQIIVGTTRGGVEIYDASDRLVHQFKVRGQRGGSVTSPTQLCPVYVAASPKPQTVVVSDLESVSHYSVDGRRMQDFQPTHAGYDLAFQPSSLAVDPIGQIVLVDRLNHAVGLFDDQGNLARYVVEPNAKDAGFIQAVALGPQGHLVCTEYSSNSNQHRIGFYRYRDCTCHPADQQLKNK